MSTTQTEALKLALEALEKHREAPKDWACKECVPFSDILKDGFKCKYHAAITAIKETLMSFQDGAQPEQRSVSEHLEPVAWMNDEMDCIFFDAERPDPFDFDFWKPLYTTPPYVATPRQRTWVGLTDEDKMVFLAKDFGGNRLDAMDWAEERLKEKNNVSQ